MTASASANTAAPRAESVTTPKRMAINVAVNWLYLVTNIVGSLVIVPFLIQRLNEERYGVWATIASLLNYLMLLDLGVTSAVNRFVARDRMLNRADSISRTVASALLIFGVFGLLVAGAWQALSGPFLSAFGKIPPDARAEAIIALQVVGAGVAIRLLHGPFIGLMAGYQRHYINNLVSIAIVLTRVGMIFTLCLAWKTTIYVPALAFIAASSIGLLVQIGIARLTYPAVRIAPWHARRENIAELMSLGGHVFLINLSTMTAYQGGNFVLTALVGPQAVTPFSAGMLIILTVLQGLDGISTLFTPLVSSMAARDPQRPLGEFLLRSGRLMALLSGGVCTLLIACGGPFIRLWLGPNLLEAYHVLLVMVPAMCIVWPNMIVHNALLGISRAGELALGWLLAALLSTALSCALVALSDWRGVAAAIAVALPIGLMQLYWLPRLAQRHFEMPLPGYYLGVLLRPLLAVLLVGGAGYVAAEYLTVSSWPALLIFGLLIGAAYLAIASAVTLDASLRSTLLNLLARRAATPPPSATRSA